MHIRNMALPEFITHINNKILYCIGAGKNLKELCTYSDLRKRIGLVFDNDKMKQENGVVYAEKHLDVKAFSLLPEFILEPTKTVLLVTASMAGGGKILFEEIKKMALPNAIEIFFWNFIVAAPGSIVTVGDKLSFRITEQMHISKCIHYCWFGGNEIPKCQQELIKGWREKCPDFEIIRWDESNYDVKQNAYIRKAYNLGKWAFVSDYARKDIIYRYGGVYLDVDVEIIRPLDDLLYQKGFLGIQPDRRIATGLGFGAEPGLSVIGEMRDVYLNEKFLYVDKVGMKVAPDYETEVLENRGYIKNGEMQKVAELTIYPGEVLSGTLPYSNEPFITENTFTVHHYAGSWTEESRKQSKNEAAKLYEEVKLSEKSYGSSF